MSEQKESQNPLKFSQEIDSEFKNLMDKADKIIEKYSPKPIRENENTLELPKIIKEHKKENIAK